MKLLYKLLLGLTILLGAAALYLWPIFKNFPMPSGKYSVGTVAYKLEDDTRPDPYTNKGMRELMVHVYYPSDRTNKNERFSYQADQLNGVAYSLSQDFFIPSWIWRYWLLYNLQSYAQSSVSLARSDNHFPLLLYLPGIGGENVEQSYLEELASHGYIVVAITFPGDTRSTVFPDGTIVGLNEEFKKAIQKNDRDAIYAHRTKAHNAWLQDINFILKDLEQKNADTQSHLYNALDTKRIGVLGASHGGGVALEFCRSDERCKAAINMDGWTKTTNSTVGFKKPVLLLVNEQGMDPLLELHKNMQSYSEYVVIDGAAHSAFGDLIMLKWPLWRLLGIANKDPLQVRNDILNHIVTFFDTHLKTL